MHRPQPPHANTSTANAAAAANVLFQQAAQAFHSGQLQASRQLLHRLLALAPKYADALQMLGVIAGLTNDPLQAVGWFRRAIEADSKSATAHSNLGGALNDAGEFDAALKSCDRALRLKPSYAEAHNNRGNALMGLNRLEAAFTSYERAIAIRPEFADAHNNRGNALRGLKRLEAALASYDKAIALNPDFKQAYSHRGNVLAELKQFEAAIASCDLAIAIDPDYVDAHVNRGVALIETGQLEAAVASCDRAIELDANCTDAHMTRGAALVERGVYDAALASFDRAIELEPDFPEAYCSRGMALAALGQLQAALDSCDRALEINPNFAEAHNSRGNILRQLGEFDMALASYERAIALDPEAAAPYLSKGILLLLKEDFANGWAPYERRWLADAYNQRLGSSVQRLADDWDGKSRPGSLLVLPEQGVGDQIFYSGMLRDLHTHVSMVTVCLDARLVPLYERSFANIRFESKDTLTADTRFDFQTSLPSLGRWYRSDADSFQAVRVPYLFADRARVEQLRARLKVGAKLVCGLSWESRNRALGADKSLTLDSLKPVLLKPYANFVDLQYGDTSEEREAFFTQTGIKLQKVPEIDNFSDLDGLAALIAACDVVVTVSNTTAHLAAALGKPVFILVPRATTWALLWYWHLDRTDSPWYPTARLYRQSEAGDWNAALASVEADLARLYDAQAR